MASELVRFGIAIDGDLLARFDEKIESKGYANRSEAIRDLIRADLVEHVDGETEASGALTLVYDHHVRELTEKLTEMQHDLGARVVSTLHVHLDHDNCLEVIVMRGPAGVLRRAADRLVAIKGVQHGRLTLTGTLGAARHQAHETQAHEGHAHASQAHEGHAHEGHAHASHEHGPRRKR